MQTHATMMRTASGHAAGSAVSSGLPTDLLRRSTERLRILAFLYAGVFFLSGFFPALLFEEPRAQVFGSFRSWGPGAIAITVAILVGLATRSRRFTPEATLAVGLGFEVAGSYGIAGAEFLDPTGLSPEVRWLGLSWVAVWTLLFTIVVPTRPRRAVAAALLSVSAVPVMVSLGIATSEVPFRLGAGQFFFGLVFPYLLVVGMAYVGARVVYNLGTEVKRARDMGSYRLVERLGQGGMGEVWRAEHLMLVRPAAIKLIHPSLTGRARPDLSEQARLRFEREAQAIASLRSPHTVQLFDFGVTEDGAFYYVMELLDGLDADALVRRCGPVPAERAIHLLRQICHSLSEAESRGLVHRDIKPANIFLCRLGEDHDFVKVLDFGLVSSPEADASRAQLTGENSVPGTPAFMAPEQSLGGAAVDRRADIYATGCVAYWLLTGQLVFDAPTPIALLLQHAKAMPTAPSARTELPVPPALDALVLECLAKDPAARPPSARELSRRLGEILVPAPWNEERARDWWRKHHPA